MEQGRAGTGASHARFIQRPVRSAHAFLLRACRRRLRRRARRQAAAAVRRSGRAATSPATGSASCSPSPMDAVGCSNLICGTITLFYDHLRATLGTGNFFRYCRHVPVRRRLRAGRLQPARRLAAAQVRDDPAARRPRRCSRRSTTAASRCWRCPRRARAAAARSCSRPGTRSCDTGAVRGARTRRAPAAPATPTCTLVGNRVVESYVEQAIFSTPGLDAGYQARLRRLRRNIDREEKQSVEEYRTLAEPGAARALLGVTQVLPPGHQELTRRATPTMIMPVEVPMPPLDGDAAPFDIAAAAALAIAEPAPSGAYPDGLLRHRVRRGSSGGWAARSRSGRAGTGSPTSATRSPSTTPCARRSASGTSRRCASGSSAGPDALRGGRPLLHARHGRARGRPGALRRRSATSSGRMLGDGIVYRGEDDDERARRDGARHRRRPLPPGHAPISTSRSSSTRSRCRTCRCRGRARASCWPALTRRRRRRAALLPLLPATRSRSAGVDGCCVSRTGYSGELGYEVFCPAERRRARSGRRCSTRAPRSASGPTASRRSSRCASRPA